MSRSHVLLRVSGHSGNWLRRTVTWLASILCGALEESEAVRVWSRLTSSRVTNRARRARTDTERIDP